MRLVILTLFIFCGLSVHSKTYLKIQLENTNHVIIFDGTLYVSNGVFEGEMDAGKHAISVLKHNYDIENGKVKTEVVYEGILDLSDNMFYVYKLSSVYLSFVSVDVYEPIVNDLAVKTETATASTAPANNNLPIGTAMDEVNFDTFSSKLKDKSNDNQKMDFVKSTMKNNWFTCDQVLLILQSLSFENNKVELAKILWHKTTDKGNFFKVYDAFTFSTSEKSVQEYVNAQN